MALNVELGSPKEILNMVEFGFKVFEGMKERGLFSDLGNDFKNFLVCFGTAIAKANVEAYKIYKEAGMTDEMAMQLISEDLRHLKKSVKVLCEK